MKIGFQRNCLDIKHSTVVVGMGQMSHLCNVKWLRLQLTASKEYLSIHIWLEALSDSVLTSMQSSALATNHRNTVNSGF